MKTLKYSRDLCVIIGSQSDFDNTKLCSTHAKLAINAFCLGDITQFSFLLVALCIILFMLAHQCSFPFSSVPREKIYYQRLFVHQHRHSSRELGAMMFWTHHRRSSVYTVLYVLIYVIKNDF